MLDEKFVILGSIIFFIGGISYLIDTLRGKARPNKVTWFLWSTVPMIAFVAEIKQGVGIQSLMTFMLGFSPILIFLASFVNKKSGRKIGKFDIICGSLSVIGLILWQITKVDNLAIFFSILADSSAALPTIIKSYKAPETENYHIYLAAVFYSLITLGTIKIWNFAHWAFPAYIFLLNLILVGLVQFKLGPKFQKNFA